MRGRALGVFEITVFTHTPHSHGVVLLLLVSMPSLTVLQQWIGGDPPEFAARATCRNFEWAQRHRYTYEFHLLERATNASWAASWERIPLMLDLLRRGRSVLWLDTDLQVIDHQHSWEHVLSSCDAPPDLAMLTDRAAVAHFLGKGGRWCCGQRCNEEQPRAANQTAPAVEA